MPKPKKKANPIKVSESPIHQMNVTFGDSSFTEEEDDDDDKDPDWQRTPLFKRLQTIRVSLVDICIIFFLM